VARPVAVAGLPGPWGVRLGVVAQNAHEVLHIVAVRDQRRLDNAAVDLHPLEKSFDQSVALESGLNDRDDASLTEMLEESADTRDDLSVAVS
jgi:hypothetical protein